MVTLTIGRLRGGYRVHWTGPDGKRQRYQLAAQSRAEAEAEAEGRNRYPKETTPGGRLTVATIWAACLDHLGAKPTAKTMRATGNAVLPVFGTLRPD